MTDDDAGVVGGADAMIDGLLRELGRGGAPGADETFVGRVLRATAPRRRSTRRRAWMPLAVAAGLLLCLAGAWGWHARPICHLVDAEGALVRAAGWRPFGGLGPGDAIEVAAGGRGALEWADGSRVVLGSASRVELPGRSDPFTLRLGNGRVDATISPQPTGRPFTLVTAEATLTVEGTAFTVTTGAAGTAVALRHGALRVTSPAGEVRLQPGEATAVIAGRPPSLSTASDAPVRFREAHVDAGWTWRADAVTAQARWYEVDGTWTRVMAFTAAKAPGTALLPVPVLPTRWRAILQVRVRPHGGAGQVALAVGDARLPLAFEPGAWRRIHVVGDSAAVALAGSSTQLALTRPVEVLGVAITDADVDIGEVVVLEEGP